MNWQNRTRPGIIHRTLSPFESHPDTFLAAKTGAPAMESLRPSVPVSVPAVAAGGQNGISDVSATQIVTNTDAIDKAPDARLNTPAATDAAAPAAAAATPVAASTPQGTGEQRAGVATSTVASASPATGRAVADQSPADQRPIEGHEEGTGKGGEGSEKEGRSNARCTERGRGSHGNSRRNSSNHHTAHGREMSRILLADDSPHAQRMGERILRDEGHEVITVSDGLVAMLRLKDAQPDLIIADISMPEVSGYELCEYIKNNGGAPVFLTAGAVEPVDESEVARVRADGVLKKPFEASLLLAAVGRFAARGESPRTPVPLQPPARLGPSSFSIRIRYAPRLPSRSTPPCRPSSMRSARKCSPRSPGGRDANHAKPS